MPAGGCFDNGGLLLRRVGYCGAAELDAVSEGDPTGAAPVLVSILGEATRQEDRAACTGMCVQQRNARGQSWGATSSKVCAAMHAAVLGLARRVLCPTRPSILEGTIP